jgi:hypothetical protein
MDIIGQTVTLNLHDQRFSNIIGTAKRHIFQNIKRTFD